MLLTILITFFIFRPTLANPIEFVSHKRTTFSNYWSCVGIKSKIDFTKPYPCNVGDLPLVIWKNRENVLLSSLNICKHTGSKLDKGKIVNGCLKCPYHGMEYTEKDTYGKVVEQDGKIFWGNEPVETSPPKTPFFENKKFAKSFIEIDMECSLEDSVYNTMDIRHPEYVHSFGFGSSNKPLNIRTYDFTPKLNAVGLSFDYQSNKWMKYLNDMKTTTNYHMYIYPAFTWSRVSFGQKDLIISVNFLPISPNKTRWFVSILHNYNTSPIGKCLMKLLAKVILLQDFHQLKNQYSECALKRDTILSRMFEDEEAILLVYQLLQRGNQL